jgi:dihydroxyacetone kinase DhaKLM complex PTS-EIIA-like component DhaM
VILNPINVSSQKSGVISIINSENNQSNFIIFVNCSSKSLFCEYASESKSENYTIEKNSLVLVETTLATATPITYNCS